MKRLAAIALLCVFSLALCRAQQADKKDSAQTVAVDPGFLETLADYQMILREIERLELATGTVDIPVSLAELRNRSNAKLLKIKGWMKEHNVGEDWQYNSQARTFTAPIPKPEAKK